MRLFCKLENLQRTGSFKERGARNALLLLDHAQAERGVIAASAGNHALGLAYHGRLLNIPVTVVMPRFAPLVKYNTCRRLGANVILHGASFLEAKDYARRLGEERGYTYIHGYDDPAIIAGQGTMAWRSWSRCPRWRRWSSPWAAAGSWPGWRWPSRRCGRRSRSSASNPRARRSSRRRSARARPCKSPATPPSRDGLAVPDIGANAFPIARDRIDKLVTVNEDEIALAILRIVELEKAIVEGSGATGLAACLAGKLPELAGKCVVLPFCGGNIDPAILSRVIEKGLVADGRICRFSAVISDRPGGLAGLTALIAETGASIKEIVHERAFTGGDVFAVGVLCTIETRDRAHLEEIFGRLDAEQIPHAVAR